MLKAQFIDVTETIIKTPNPLPEIWGDPVQISQLFQNIISNAIKFQSKTHTPVITIESHSDDAEMTCLEQSDHIQIFRKRGRDERGGILYGDQETSAEKLPIIVEYVSLFSKEQIDDALRQLFASDVDIETKLLFGNILIHTPAFQNGAFTLSVKELEGDRFVLTVVK